MKRLQIKSNLKQLALDIRKLKASRGPENNGFVFGLAHAQHIYRHRHIAYCLLRGTPYESIENPKEENKADQKLVDKFKEEYHEAFCSIEQQAV